MDRHDVVRELEKRLGCTGRVTGYVDGLGLSGRHLLLIGASWAALVVFILYPEFQLLVFAAAVVGVAVSNRNCGEI